MGESYQGGSQCEIHQKIPSWVSYNQRSHKSVATVPQRIEQITRWLRHDVGLPPFDLAPASADASFRRYFRIAFGGETRIVMDAPPDKEDTGPFIKVARMFDEIGLHVPRILQENRDSGFLLLSDLGNEQYLPNLNEKSVGKLYRDALDALAELQAKGPRGNELPPYDRALLLREMELFREWFIGRHLHIKLGEEEQDILNKAFDLLAESALEQPSVAVHRDYHSRNLMVIEPNPGILDFQDAVIGPFTYDLVSVLRDCYIDWPRNWVEQWALGFHDLSLQNGVTTMNDQAEFLRWFDLMGVQRHLKAIGIFARLNHRDGKPGYLKDIPRTLNYVRDVASRYRDLKPLGDFIESRVVTVMLAA
jgi:aminoglycoside/choline kinase family phosphotransferase